MTPSRSSSRNDEGFTVFETLVYISLAAIMLSALLFVHVSSLNTRNITAAKQRLHDERFRIEELLISRLEQASAVADPASGSGTRLEIDAPDAGQDPAVFALDGEDLTLSEGGAAAVALNDEAIRVTEFAVERLEGAPPALAIDVAYAIDVTQDLTVDTRTSFTYVLRRD